MMIFRPAQLCALPLVVCSFLGVATPPVEGAEQVKVFIEKLRERGYYDVAVEYMDEMKDSPLADDEFRETYLYELGLLLTEYARTTSDAKLRDQLYTQAREKLEIYGQGNAGTLGGARALTELGNILVERGRQLVQKANLPTQKANKDTLITEARTLFDQALKMFENVEEFYRSELKDSTRFPKSIDPTKDKALFELRQEYRAQFVKTGLDVATVVYEKAQTYDPTSAEGKKLLTDAADRFGKLYENYRVWLAGLYARMYQGRCFQDMKDYKTAISYYDELLAQPADDPVFRTLITKTNVQLAQCLMAQAEEEKKPEKYDELVAKILPWVQGARTQEEKTLDIQQLKYFCALAYEKRADTLTDPADATVKKQLPKKALELAKGVANSRFAGDYAKLAQEMVLRLRGKEGEVIAPETFAEALELGKDAVSTMELLKQDAKSIPPDKTEDISKAKLEIDAQRAEAYDMLRLALTFVDDKVRTESPDEINLVRYYLCYLNWDMGRYYDAAVLGEFLARKFSDSGGARPAANIAMAAYLQAYNDPDNRDKEFEAERVTDMAEFITRRWPGGIEADDAHNMLVNFAIQRSMVEEAVQYLDKMSADYVNRGKAELKVGQELWRKYLRLNKLEGAEKKPAAELDALKQQALTTLLKGVDRMRTSGEVSSTVASAMYSLAQIYLDTGEIDKAVATLEEEKIGPLKLVEAKDPAANFPGYAEAVYQLALRAYVTIKPPRLEDAQRAMDSLETQVKAQGEAGAAEKLTQILIGLGRQLQEMMKLAKDEAERQSIASSFEVFLQRIASQDEGNTWASRNWIASTYYDLGSGLEQGGKQSKKSKEYFAKATAAYEKIIKDVADKKVEAPSPDSILSVEMRLAECERKGGNFAAALDRLGEVLGKKPMMLDAQIAAAYTYQQRGVEDPKWYRSAYIGGRKDPTTKQNRIWGWSQLSKKTQTIPKFKSIFYESRYNLAYSRFEYAKSLKGEDRKKYLDYAYNDVGAVYKLYPDMGGDEWKEKYESLFKSIQKEMGKKPDGLKAIDAEVAANTAKKPS